MISNAPAFVVRDEFPRIQTSAQPAVAQYTRKLGENKMYKN